MSGTYTDTTGWDPTGPSVLTGPDTYWIEFGAHVEALVSYALMYDSCGVEHIGATAISGLPARPTADVALRIAPHASTQDIIDRLAETGWACHGEDPVIGGLLFTTIAGGPYPALLRAVGHDDPRWQRWLSIRETLKTDPQRAAAYGDLKRATIGTDRYAQATSDFLNSIAGGDSAELPLPAVRRVRGLLITPAGKVLLVRRTKPNQPVHWVMPGGGIDPGDGGLEATAVREVAEETGGTPRLHRLVHIADVVGQRHAVFLAHMPSCDPAARTGPEFTDPDPRRGRYDLEELALDHPAFTDGRVWPVPTAQWAARLAAAETNLFDLPDVRESQTVDWAARDTGTAMACEACDRRAGAR